MTGSVFQKAVFTLRFFLVRLFSYSYASIHSLTNPGTLHFTAVSKPEMYVAKLALWLESYIVCFNPGRNTNVWMIYVDIWYDEGEQENEVIKELICLQQ